MTNSLQQAISKPLVSFGFGDYKLPDGKEFSQIQTREKITRIALTVFLVLANLALTFVLLHISLPIAVVSCAAFSYLISKEILKVGGVFNRAPPMQNLFPREALDRLPPIGEVSNKPCSGFPTKDGVHSHKWKLELIRAARHSLILSGCYCGGIKFDETLDLIRDQMRLHPKLKTEILTSEIYISRENQKRITALSKEFPGRFICTKTPEVISSTSLDGRYTLSTNHTKALIVDFGRLYMVGGSGLLDCWANRQGTEDPIDPGESHGSWLFNTVLSKSHRDMDFVYKSDLNGSGTRAYVEMKKLIERYRYRETGKIETPEPWPEQVETDCSAFDSQPNKTEGLKVACFATGPEQEENSFFEEIVAQVEQAKESIVIDHMYFHPPKRFLEALIRAADRGVKITIITNKSGSKSPWTHFLYAALSRYAESRLYRGKANSNIAIHEYTVPQSTLHKKVMVFDRKTSLIGSANIGEKSLGTGIRKHAGHDYEIDLKIESPGFAESILETVEKDKQLCEPLATPEKFPWDATFQLPFQSLLTNLL